MTDAYIMTVADDIVKQCSEVQQSDIRATPDETSGFEKQAGGRG